MPIAHNTYISILTTRTLVLVFLASLEPSLAIYVTSEKLDDKTFYIHGVAIFHMVLVYVLPTSKTMARLLCHACLHRLFRRNLIIINNIQ